MRKFFTFIAAMMLSVVAVNATIVTNDVTWSPFTAEGTQWTATETGYKITLNQWASCDEMWGWAVGAGDYEQLVIEVADHTGDIHVFAKFCEGEKQPDLVSAGVLHAGTNSLGIDVKAAILHSLQVKNFSGSDNVDITVTGLYFRKATGTIKTDSLLTTPVIFEDFKGWGEEIILDQTKFAKINAGDVLELNYTVDEHTYHQFKIQSSWLTYFPAFLGTLDAYNQYNIATDVHPTQVRFTILDETDITNLKTQGGIHVNAKYLTLNSIVLYWHDDKATAIDEVSQSQGQSQKLIKNGQLFILRDDKTYTLQGQRIQ